MATEAVTTIASAEPGVQLLTKLGEAGGITGMVALVLVVVIRLIQKNGCTFKCYNCSGKPMIDLDCEEGTSVPRFKANNARTTRADVVEVSVDGNTA